MLHFLMIARSKIPIFAKGGSMLVLFMLFAACTNLGDSPSTQTGKTSAKVASMETTRQQTLRFTDGTPTLITVVRQEDADVARQSGEVISDRQFAKGEVRAVTVLNFQNALPSAFQQLTLAQISADLQATAKRLQPMYTREGVDTNPMQDLHVVADFSGTTSRNLGAGDGQPLIILVDGNGKTVERWQKSPSKETFQQALSNLVQ